MDGDKMFIARSQITGRLKRRFFPLLLPLITAFSQPAAAQEDPALPLFKYAPQTLTDANRERVAELYFGMCSGCHGMGGGQSNGLALFGAKNPQQDAAAIHFGRTEPIPATAYATPVVMPPYGGKLTPVQIGELVAYIMTFRAPWP